VPFSPACGTAVTKPAELAGWHNSDRHYRWKLNDWTIQPLLSPIRKRSIGEGDPEAQGKGITPISSMILADRGVTQRTDSRHCRRSAFEFEFREHLLRRSFHRHRLFAAFATAFSSL